MVQTIEDASIISITEAEKSDVQKVERLISDASEREASPLLKLISSDGSIVELPQSIVDMLQTALQYLAQGQAITLFPTNQELTTQQAADLLNVSRPYLVKILERGDIPYTKTGTHRRVRLANVMDYKAQRDGKRGELLSALTQLSQELGLYE